VLSRRIVGDPGPRDPPRARRCAASYDPQGGYGHPDHVKVHQVGARAAQMTSTRILEATVPRELVALLFCPLRLMRLAVR
jgi:hypothetical protein